MKIPLDPPLEKGENRSFDPNVREGSNAPPL
jgi:hypothetical protein